MGVKSTEKSALDDLDFYRYATFLVGSCEGSEQALLFAPNSENMGITKDAREFPRLHHVWSISTVRFFNCLDLLIKKSAGNKKIITDKFPVIFPPPGEFFSASDACGELEKVLGRTV